MDRITLFKNMMVLAAADGKITEEELQWLASRSERWGITDQQFHEALTEAGAADAAVIIPPDHADRRALLIDMVRMMAVDGELAEIEKQLFAVVAAQMQISDAELNSLLDALLE